MIRQDGCSGMTEGGLQKHWLVMKLVLKSQFIAACSKLTDIIFVTTSRPLTPWSNLIDLTI